MNSISYLDKITNKNEAFRPYYKDWQERHNRQKNGGLPSRHRYSQADRSEFEGHSKPNLPHLLHQGYHSVKKQHAKSTLHHGTKPDSTEVTQICETSEHENNIYMCVCVCVSHACISIYYHIKSKQKIDIPLDQSRAFLSSQLIDQ